MSAISLKSITGITSITTPAGVDNQLTLHNNNTTEAVKLDIAGNLHFHNHLNITGVSTASNFKTGTSNLHNTGLNVFDLDVDGHTNLDNVSIAGVTTFTSGNVQLASDSQRLQLGSAQDLWMYHTGTSGGGHGLIQNEYGIMYMLSAGWEYRHYGTNQTTFKINNNGNVTLYYQGSGKLSSTSYGAQIDTILRLYGAAGSGGGRLRLAEGAAYSEIRGVRNTDTSSELWFGTEISDTVDYRAKINTGGHFIPGTDSTYDLGLTGTRWRNLYADTLYGDGANITGDILLGAHGSRIFDDSSGTNVVVDIYGGTTAGKRGILALGGRTGSDNADIGTIQFLNENNANATSSSHVQSKLVASIDVKSETTNSNASANSGSHLIFSTKAQNAAIAEALRITSGGDISIGGRDEALNNYAAGNTTTKLAVVKNGAGSGYHEIAHFTGGTDTNDTGAIVRITQFNNDRGLYIKGGRGTSDQAKAIFGLRNSGAVDSDVMTFLQGGAVGINYGSPTQAQLVVSNSSGNTIAAVKTGNAGAVALGGPTQPRILMEAGQSDSDLLIYTAGGSSWGSPSWSEKFRLLEDGGIQLSNTGGGHLIQYGGSSVNTVAAIDINRNGNGYADIRLASNYGASLRLAGAGNNTDEYNITQDNQRNAYHNLEYNGFINFVTNNTIQAMRLENGKVGIAKNIETLTGNGFNAALQVTNKTTDGYGTIMMGGGYNRATIGIGNVYDLILTSNAYPANASTGGIKFRCGTSGGGGPHERFRIHQDGMLSTKQDGTSKTYMFSSGRSGGYSSLTITIDAHAYHSFVITVAHAGYAGSWTTSKFLGYENGSMYYGNEGTETTDSNSRNVTHDQNPGGGHIHRIRITGGMGTHPVCELRITIGGPDAYIDTGDVAFTWS